MKKYYFYLVLVFSVFCNVAPSQDNQWIWVRGDTLNNTSVYGTKGVSNIANEPGGRYEAVAEWVDTQGRFWLYGGSGVGRMADMWMYDPASNEWTWIAGADTANSQAIYGTQGVSSPTNTPGYRYQASASWTDANGNLWLFGGSGTGGTKNDLWMFDTSSNEWTWVHGSQGALGAGVFGSKGVISPTNIPGARQESAATWIDSNGDLWLFGGEGRDATGQQGALNDLWRFDMANKMWAWESGDQIRNQVGVYGTKGIPSASNKPGARSCYSAWISNTGELYLFGGIKIYNGRERYNDLWKYNTTTGMWTWVHGSASTDPIGDYGTQCIPSPTNTPGNRFENRIHWKDDCGNFWMFGGYQQGATRAEHMNDLWRYKPSTNEWTWMHGNSSPSQSDVFGTMGVPSDSNTPGARFGAQSWSNNNELWVYGGNGPMARAALWKFTINSPDPEFSTTPTCGSAPLDVNFYAKWSCSDNVTYSWDFGDPSSGAANASTEISPSHIYNTSGTYTVTLYLSNCAGEKDSAQQVITVGSLFPVDAGPDQSICNGGSIQLAVTTTGSDIEWSPSTGLSDPTIINPIANPTTTTQYVVTVSDGGVCSATDTVSVLVSDDMNITVTDFVANGCDRFGGNSGSATVVPDGGTAPYTYLWNTTPPQTTETATGLQAGTYTVTVTDSIGCSGSRDITIEDLIQLEATVVDPSCASCADGTASVSVAGNGTPPFTYRWNPGDQTTADVTGLTSGTYNITVTDSNGCFTTLEIQVGIISVNDAVFQSVIIFPNPSKGKLFISGIDIGEHVGTQLYDVKGTLVKQSSEFYNEEIDLDLSALTNGIYILNILIGEHALSERIILNR